MGNQRPNPAYRDPKPPKRKRVRRRSKPIMVTVQQVYCKSCRRSFELNLAGSAVFCIWCRSDKIQKSIKTRRENPAERKRREFEMNARFINAGFRLIAGLFGFRPDPGFDPQPPPPPGIRNGSALEAEFLKEGYRKLAQKYHPDKGGDPEKMKELNRLKEKLGL